MLIINDMIKKDTPYDIDDACFVGPVTNMTIGSNDIPDFLNYYFVNIADRARQSVDESTIHTVEFEHEILCFCFQLYGN